MNSTQLTSDADLFLQCLNGGLPTNHPHITQLVSEAKSNRALATQRAPTHSSQGKWRISQTCVSQVLFKLFHEQSTGFLVAQHEEAWKVLAYQNGYIKNAHSSDHGELLGQMLLRDHKISQKTIASWVEKARVEHKPLGWALLHVLSAETLLEAMSAQAEQRIVQLCFWKDGELAFFADLKALELTPTLDVSVVELIRQAVMQTAFTEIQLRVELLLQTNQLLCLSSTFDDTSIKTHEKPIYELLWNSVYAHELKEVLGNTQENYRTLFMFDKMGVIANGM
jgi:hypothetical protein